MGNHVRSKPQWTSLCWAVLGVGQEMAGLAPVSRKRASPLKSSVLRLVTLGPQTVTLSEFYSPCSSEAMAQSSLGCFSKD